VDLQKRFSVYAVIIHIAIICLFAFWGTSTNSDMEDEKTKITKIIEIDVFKPAKNAIVAETITDDDFIKKILSTENFSKTYSQKEKIERAEKKEKEKSEKARIINAKKENDKKIARNKIKERIKKENKIIQEKLEKDKKALAKKRKEEKKAQDLLDNEKKMKKKRDLKLKEKDRIKRLKKAAEKKALKNYDKKTLTKTEWLDTASGKKDYNIYSSALYRRVYGEWVKPFHAKTGWNCSLEIHQDRNGRVKNIKEINCNPNNRDLKNSVQKAVMRASPLPLPKDPRLFDKTVIFKFSVE